jgi:hypothetical protein
MNFHDDEVVFIRTGKGWTNCSEAPSNFSTTIATAPMNWLARFEKRISSALEPATLFECSPELPRGFIDERGHVSANPAASHRRAE